LLDKESKKFQALESFLKSDLVEEDYKQRKPDEYKIIKKYPLRPPFTYANILYNEASSDYLYWVDELKLSHEEERIYENLYHLIEESLDSPEKIKDESDFKAHLNKVIKEHEKMFFTNNMVGIEKVKYYLQRDIAGYGIIDGIMHDTDIEDISCSGVGEPIYIWHRKYDSIPTNVQFNSSEKLDSFIAKTVFKAGKHISTAHPISDLALEGNHRLSVLYQTEITPKGTSFTIRKFREEPYTVIDLIENGTIDIPIAAYLWMLIEAKLSLIIIGSTGSGKTTLLNAITGLANPNHKIFSVEDVAEINIDHKNWFTLVSRSGFGTGGEGEIGLYDLIRAGVRHRPDYIIVGEIRGSEAYVMFQAMATGHGGLCTMHADSLNSAIKRLEQKPMDIPPSYIPLMNCAITVRRVKVDSSRWMTRKTVEITEIVSSTESHAVFAWNPKTDYFKDEVKQSILFERIATSTGQGMDEILEDYNKRIKILQWMFEHDIHNYKETTKIIGQYYREPKQVMQKIESEA